MKLSSIFRIIHSQEVPTIAKTFENSNFAKWAFMRRIFFFLKKRIENFFPFFSLSAYCYESVDIFKWIGCGCYLWKTLILDHQTVEYWLCIVDRSFLNKCFIRFGDIFPSLRNLHYALGKYRCLPQNFQKNFVVTGSEYLSEGRVSWGDGFIYAAKIKFQGANHSMN